MIQKSPAIEKLLAQYLHLSITGKKIRCPYWMNILHPRPGDSREWGPYGGKGKPHQIVQVINKMAKLDGVDLEKMGHLEIKRFMISSNIGIDCSGLAYWLLDALDREKGGNGLEDDIPGVRGKYLIRASVAMLTNSKVSVPVKKVSAIQIGDMIRLRGGKHLALVVRIKKVRGEIKELIYAHSSDLSWFKGAHTGKILVRDSEKGLADQEWLEKTREGENYGREYFRAEEGDGVRRLKLWI